MSAYMFESNTSRWQWRWEDMCGPDGLKLWSPAQHDLGLCFQQLCLQIPTLALFAIFSAYYLGQNVNFVSRGRIQMNTIKIRCGIVILLLLLPVIQIYIDLNKSQLHLPPISFLLSVTQCVTWIVHLMFLSALKTRLGISPRGPIIICVCWSLLAVLTIISFRSHLIIYRTSPIILFSTMVSLYCSLVGLILQFLYGLTFLVSEGSTTVAYYSPIGSRYAQIGERSSLIVSSHTATQHAYGRFMDIDALDMQDNLGIAMERAPFLSQLFLHWVGTLINKGAHGTLRTPDDLFDLPDDITCVIVGAQIDKALSGNVDSLAPRRRSTLTSDMYGSFSSTPPNTHHQIPTVTYSSTYKVKFSLLKGLHTCFGVQFYSIGMLKLLADCAAFAGPLLLNRLVSFIENRNEIIEMGYLYAAGLIGSSLVVALCNTHFNFQMNMVGLKIRAALITLIYRKTLTVSSTVLNSSFSIGEIVNFMSTDTDRIVNSCPSFHAFWSIPFQLGITLFLLYEQVGLAFLAGLLFSIVLIPINKMIASKIGDLSTKMMERKDERVKIITEALRGIRTLKLNVWEDHFIRIITKFRDGELKFLKGRKYLDALCVYFWATTPVLVATLTLGTVAITQSVPLTAARVFTAIALLNMLIAPLNAFPWVLNGLMEAWVSLKRVQRFIDLRDLDLDEYYNQSTLNDNSNVHVDMKNVSFNWGKVLDSKQETEGVIKPGERISRKDTNKRKKSITKTGSIQIRDPSQENEQLGEASSSNIVREVNGSEKFVRFEDSGEFHLENINLTIKKGEFIGIIGQVGSGKSTLLSAILAEVEKESGDIAVMDLDYGFGYVAQQPWLRRGTVRDNVLFGRAYDESHYREVMSACCLLEDEHQIIHDIPVSSSINSPVSPTPEQLNNIDNNDVNVEEDNIEDRSEVNVEQLRPGGLTGGVGDSGSTLSGGQRARIALARAVYQDKPIYLLDDVFAAVDAKVANHIFRHCLMGLLKNKTKILCTHHMRFLLHANKVVVLNEGRIVNQGKPNDILCDMGDLDTLISTDLELSETDSVDSPALTPVKRIRNMSSSSAKDAVSENDDDSDSILQEEFKETGAIDFSVYATYWKSIGHLLSLAIIISMFLMQTSRNMTDLWLSFWVSSETSARNSTNVTNEFDMNDNSGNKIVLSLVENSERFSSNGTNTSDWKFYLTVYVAFAGLNSLFTLFRAFLFAYGGIQAATKIHKYLLKAIIRAKITFFDVSPLGRILNRFSSDTYTIDDSLPFILNILLAQLFGLIGSIIVTIYGLPWLCLVLVPLIPIYHWLQHQYRLTSRELKRLSSLTLSPVYSHFNETLQGLSTIRALRCSHRFAEESETRLETSQRAQFCSQAAAQWLGIRLQLIGVALLAGVAAIAVLQHQFDVADPGLVGLAIAYALSITSLLSGVLNAFTETEREMIAVERVTQYIDQVEPEESNFSSNFESLQPPYAWPSQGVITFTNVVLRYRDHLSPSLKGVSFETRPAEKIGVVGRTGAGKSSLLMALFRAVELYAGEINIDTVNISKLSLPALRSRLWIIPQEPFLWSGSVRDNLDPLREHRSSELWGALTRCALSGPIRRLGGLSTSLGAGGCRLSAGQRQLLCLARAVLRNAKIICIDEATANVDMETDRLIQQTICAAFRRSTVITIAHRVQTIMHCDRVLVMGDGRVLEFDTPTNLIEDPTSHFYKIVNEQQSH